MIDTQRPALSQRRPCPICAGTGKVARIYRNPDGTARHVRGRCSLCKGGGFFGGGTL